MRNDILCPCGKPTSGSVLCSRCQDTLGHALVHVGVYAGDLETVATKRTRYGSSGATKGSIGKTQPLPVDGRFLDRAGSGSAVERDTRITLTTWCRVVMEDLPQRIGPACTVCIHSSCTAIRRDAHPADTLGAMVFYLARQHRYVFAQVWAPVILDELCRLERRLERLVNRPPEQWYAGKCSTTDPLDPDGPACEAELYATTDVGTILCRSCGTRHDVAGRREFLLEEAKGYLVTATEAAGALLAWTDYGGSEAKLVDRIRNWSRPREDRGGLARLEVRSNVTVSGRERALYRLGDIQALMVDDAQAQQKRRIGASA